MSEREPSAVELALRGVCFGYGAEAILADLDLEVRRGEVYALLGRNGAGKTTLFSLLAGRAAPARGSVRLCGRDPWRERADLLREVAIVPEQPDAPSDLPARALADFCAALYPAWDGDGFRARLARFGVSLARPFGRLSKGERGQVTLALALAARPRLLLADDPTLGLDAVARRALVEEIVGELAERGTTILIATHDFAAVEGIADRVGILLGGRLRLDEERERLRARYRRLLVPRALGLDRAALAAQLAPLAPLALVERALGWEALCAEFDAARLPAALAALADEAEPLALADLFLALAGEADLRRPT